MNDTVDLTGVLFPAFNSNYILRPNVIARECTFGVGANVQALQDLDISNSVCLGSISITAQGGRLIARGARFAGSAWLTIPIASEVDLTESQFEGHVELLGISQAGSRLRLDGAELSYPPRIALNTPDNVLPQNSSFRRLKLRKSAFGDGAEGRFRAIRNLLHKNRDRDQEGTFYAYEKRAQRMSLNYGITRFMSAAYDWLAKYGQSYERALAWLIAVQIAFGVGYCIAAGRFTWGGSFDGQVAAFTLAQLVKPFELLSARSAVGTWPYQGVYTGGSGWWTLTIVAHSLFSLTLVALFLLALRWRFRRD